MEEAIKLAIEKGGYDGGFKHNPKSKGIWLEWVRNNPIALQVDPLFWQALGKALGWGKSDLWENNKNIPHWKLHALNFFDLKLTGGNEQEFWDLLLRR